jgi:Tfp pilus assembly protein PilN
MKTKINLIPQELRKKGKKAISLPRSGQKVILLSIGIILAWKLAVGLLITKFKTGANKLQEDINSYTNKIAALKTSVETTLRTNQEKMDTLKTKISEKESELKDFGTISEIELQKEKFIYNLLKLLAENISPQVWLDEFSFNKETQTLSLKGFSLSHPPIGTFLAKLNRPPYLTDLYMNHSETKPEGPDKQNLVRFEASGKLNLGNVQIKTAIENR